MYSRIPQSIENYAKQFWKCELRRDNSRPMFHFNALKWNGYSARASLEMYTHWLIASWDIVYICSISYRVFIDYQRFRGGVAALGRGGVGLWHEGPRRDRSYKQLLQWLCAICVMLHIKYAMTFFFSGGGGGGARKGGGEAARRGHAAVC